MTGIHGSSRPNPTPSSSHSTHSTHAAAPDDVHAMRNALEAARGRMAPVPPRDGQKKAPLQQAGRQAPAGANEKGDAAEAEAATDTADQETAPLKQQGRQEGEGLAGYTGQGAAGLPTVHADLPAPQVDPSGFAQMLADLWTRENGRGSKEVRVRFGDRAWPATGARLVRNAAGTLDIALEVGDGGRAHGHQLAGLEQALGDAGVAVGTLAIEG